MIRSSFLASILAMAFAASPALAGVTVLPWPGSEANQAGHWEQYLGEGFECTKVDEGGAFTTKVDHDAIIIKVGQQNHVFQPAPAGRYTTAKGVSHWFYCDDPFDPPIEKRKSRGGGDLIGPKGDPWWRITAWYKGDRRAKAVLKDDGVVVFKKRFGDRDPDTKCVYRSPWYYVLPNSKLVYTVRETGTRKLLYREVRVSPGGYFGPLWHGFTKGVACK